MRPDDWFMVQWKKGVFDVDRLGGQRFDIVLGAGFGGDFLRGGYYKRFDRSGWRGDNFVWGRRGLAFQVILSLWEGTACLGLYYRAGLVSVCEYVREVEDGEWLGVMEINGECAGTFAMKKRGK